MRDTKGACLRTVTSAILALALPGAFAHAANPSRRPASVSTYRMSLEDAIQIGIKNATTVLKENNQLTAAGANVLQSYGRFLPNLSATAGAQTFSGRYVLASSNLFRIYGVTKGLNYNLSSSVNIFNGLGDVSSLNASLARKEAAELTLERARQQIAIDITQSYLQVILDRKIEEIARNNIAVTRDILSYLETKKRIGNATQVDIDRQKAQLASDQLSLTRASTKAQNDLLSLLDKLRFNVRNECILVEPRIELPKEGERIPTADDLMGEAMSGRTDLAASESIVRASEAEIRLNRSTYFPRLDLTFNYGASSLIANKLLVNDNNIILSSSDRGQPPLLDQLQVQTQTSIVATLTWNIFDRFVTKTKVQQADIAKENADIDAQDAQNRVRVDVKRALNDYAAAIAELDASKLGLEASQKVFDEVRSRYKVGNANFIDLNTAQLALIQAKVNWAQAVVDYRLKKDVVSFSVGNVETFSKPKS